ncbi:aldose epimerase family protein [Agriterribacter sp.]|uniref:aldose epimerase family protein n=1 Tax=Agriterribacter sp. TaxID=2821509 RepID=UPI002C12AE2A|nr:aldose epimerase family protein [Agriterribacter sp.]HTN08715.1 aldose epimerase family protein [Agriterribacter sp.]
MNKFNIDVTAFGKTQQGIASLICMSNGVVDVTITNYGATIVSIDTPDVSGNKKNITAGFSSLQPYLSNHPYIGCFIGRFANRIANGKFYLNGREYQLSINDGLNHLHGGPGGFHRQLWEIKAIISENDKVGVELFYLSKDGEEGYPGNLKVTVKYLLDHAGLCIFFFAETDMPTIVNLTNHTYFNLSGFDDGSIINHRLQIFADGYLVKNSNNIPTGEIAPVKDTVFDFILPKRIGEHIGQLAEDIGYDHDFVLNTKNGNLACAAALSDPSSGRVLKVYSNSPGVHIYTANWWDGTLTGAQGKLYRQHGAIALETQAFPDAPNHAHFPNVVLLPGELYQATTIFEFQTIS